MAFFLGQQQQLHFFVTPCNLKPKPSRNVVICASASNPPGEGSSSSSSSSVPAGKWAPALNRKRVVQPSRSYARDLIIDFGKFKGAYLGTLPERYLKWLANNLKEGDNSEYSDYAEQVLEDPVYQDRREWNRAEKYLHNERKSQLYATHYDMKAQVHARYGWVPPYHELWNRVDDTLIGTSFAKIPRVRDLKPKVEVEVEVPRKCVEQLRRESREEKLAQKKVIDTEEDARREERRARIQKSREKYLLTLKKKVVIDDSELGKFKDRVGIQAGVRIREDMDPNHPIIIPYETGVDKNPFPGRDKILTLKFAEFKFKNKEKQ